MNPTPKPAAPSVFGEFQAGKVAPVSIGNLRRLTVRGGAIIGGVQGIKFFINIGSTVLLARFLTPADYGLFAMVTGFTGVVEILKDGGLSLATVQRAEITNEQLSTLFWLNVGLGGALMLLTLGLTPLVAGFYGEPQLTGIMIALSVTLPICGLGVQHQAQLRRNLRFGVLAVIDVVSTFIGILTALFLAWRGHDHWALVGMALSSVTVNTIAVWFAMPWRPGRTAPFREIRSMIGFGGNIIGTRFVYQIVRGAPNILLGWCWGPAAVGVYQRAYALLMFTVDQIQGPVASVILPPLARLQDDPERMKSFFLTGYRLITSVILPVIVTCAIFSEEIVALLLGPQWIETAAIFRWLALGGIMVGLLSPQGLLLLAMGRADICIKLGLVDAIVVVLGYAIGVHYGTLGVAIGFFSAKLLLCAPLTVAAFRHTPVTWQDIVKVVRAPLLITALAALVGGALKLTLSGIIQPRLLALFGCATTLFVYAILLLFAARQWPFYRGLFAEFRPHKSNVQPT